MGSFLKKDKNKIIKKIKEENEEISNDLHDDELFGDDEDLNETSTSEENIETEEMKEEKEIIEENDEANLNLSKTKNKKGEKKPLDKKQVMIIGGIAVAAIGYFAMQGEDKKETGLEDLNQYDIKVNEDMTLLEASKDKDFLSRLKAIENKLNNQSNGISGNQSNIDIKKLKAKKFESYQELSNLLFTSKYTIANGEYIYRKGNQIIHHLFQGNEIVLKDMAAIPFKNGVILRLENLDTDYVIENRNENDTSFTDMKNINIWRIDPNIGLKKVIVMDVKKDILSYLYNSENDEDILIKRYTNKIALIGNNAEIKEEIDFFSQKINEIEIPTDVINQYYINEFTMADFSKFYLKDNKIFLKNQNQYEEKGIYSIKYMKYNDPEIGISEALFLFRNSQIIKKISMGDVRNISLVNYKNNDGEEYVQRNGEVFKLNQQTGLLESIGKGFIYGKITRGELESVSLAIIESSEEKMPINNLIDKILIDENNIEYKVTQDGVEYQGAILPIDEFTITSNGFLFYQDEKIAKIKEIKFSKKTGASLETKTRNIKLYSKDRYEVIDLEGNLLFNEDSYEEVKFKLDFETETITATATIALDIDRQNKLIDGKHFDTFEERNGTYYFYDVDGNVIKEAKAKTTDELFKEKIINFELIDGEIFNYYFQIDTLTGKIESDDVGKFIKKYQKDKIPFTQFMKTNRFKTKRRTIDSKLQNKGMGKQSIILLNDLLQGRRFPYITFIDIKGNKIKLLDEKNLLINDKDTITGRKIFLNQIKSKFVFDITKSMLDKNMRRRYNLQIVKNKMNWFYKNIELDDYNYIDKKDGIKLIKENNIYYLKTANDKNFNEILSQDIDIVNDNLKLMDVNDKEYNLQISKLSKMTAREETTYKDLLDRFLHPKEDDTAKLKAEKERLEREKRLKKSEEFKKQIADFENQNSTMQTIKLKQKTLNKIQEEKREPDFVFEIGTKMKFTIPESMEVIEGEQGFALGTISNIVLKDLSDNILHIKNAKIVLGLEGDFSKQKIKVSPLKIIWKDQDTGKKRVVDIPQTATQFVYREQGYSSVGVPAYMINAKLKNINTTVILSTVSGILENLTQPQDAFSALTNGTDVTGATGTNGTDNQTQTIGEAAGAGINAGIQDLIQTMKEASESEKNLLISEPNIKGYSLFIEEVEVDFGDK